MSKELRILGESFCAVYDKSTREWKITFTEEELRNFIRCMKGKRKK